LGYSASDHFDVVPLVEASVQSKAVAWMHYDPDAEEPNARRIESGAPPAVPAINSDFAEQTLAALKFRNPDANIRKLVARSVSDTLHLLASDGDKDAISEEGGQRGADFADNLAAFGRALRQFPLAEEDCEQLAVLLLERMRSMDTSDRISEASTTPKQRRLPA
jgi:hypothetical protein